jgi:hypothetical protein
MNEVFILSKLIGVREFLMNARAEAGALLEVGGAAKTMGLEMQTAGRRGFFMNQTMFTMRRLLYGTSLATLAIGGAALKMGYNYNTAIQGARVALRPFFNESSDLEDNLNRLWTIAKYSPFQIQDMTLAFSRMAPSMMRLGMTGHDVTNILKDLTDALSVGMAGRVTPAALNRASVALQHLAFLGRLTGMSVLQLARDGVPIYAALSSQLGLTADQMHNIGAMGIPAQTALEAIQRYIETTPGYANAALRISQQSVSGLWSTFKDNVSQTMGIAEKGWFTSLQRMLIRGNAFFNRLQDNLGKTHNLFKALDMTVTPRSHMIMTIWNRLVMAAQHLWSILKALFALTVGNIWVWRALAVAGFLIDLGLRLLVKTMRVWSPLLFVIIPLLIAWKVLTLGIAAGQAILDAALLVGSATMGIYRGAIWLINAAIFAWIGLERLLKLVMTGSVRGMDGRFISMTKLEKLVLRMRSGVLRLASAFAAMDAAALLNPYVLLAVAIVALIAGFTILYFKWKRFHDFVNTVARWLYNHTLILAMVPIIGPLLFVGVQIYKMVTNISRWWHDLVHWIQHNWHTIAMLPIVGPFIVVATKIIEYADRIWHAFKKIVHWAQQAYGWVKKLGSGGGGGGGSWLGNFLSGFNPLHSIPGANLIPGLAGGGTITRGGWTMVGERGPEVRYMPRGASVQPLTAQRPAAPHPITINLRAILNVDGRKMAETVARHQTSVNARR